MPSSAVSRQDGLVAEASTLARAFAGAGAVSLLTALVPFSPTAPGGVAALAGVSGVALGAALWRRRRQVPRPLLHAALALASVVVTLLVGVCTTPAGRVVTACSYLWIVLYTAAFHSRRAMLAHLALVGVGFAAALWVGDAPSAPQTWGFMSITAGAVAWTVNALVLRLRTLADRDPLTGTLSRRAFFGAAADAMALASRTRSPLTLAVVDLDDFKGLNDRQGHVAGDRALVEATASWRESLRRHDVLGRYGGDEFLLLLPATTREAADEVMGRLAGLDVPVRWTGGAAEWVVGETLEGWLARADDDLYARKRLRRDAPAGRAPSLPRVPAAR